MKQKKKNSRHTDATDAVEVPFTRAKVRVPKMLT